MLKLNFNPFPLITTERLVLRQVSSFDVNEIFFLRSDEEVLRYIQRKPAKNIEEAIQFIQLLNTALANNESINWAITIKNNPKLIGNICLWNIQPEHSRAEVGYSLHTAWQGKGIMHEAITAVLRYGFNTMKLHSIEGQVDPENTPSIKLLEKNGFVREAYFKENFFFNGKFFDSAVYSLLAPTK